MTVYLSVHVNGLGIVHDAARPFQFPGGEWHLKDIAPEFDEGSTYIADVRGASTAELVVAALWGDVAIERGASFTLLLPYLPAARADRGLPEGAYVYGQLVNAMSADQVIVIDPHSPAATRWTCPLSALSPVPLVERALGDAGHERRYDGIIAPDGGATERAQAVADALRLKLYQAKKRRDFDTGELLSYEMLDYLPKYGRYLVVDDICDGGGTFKMLANETGLHADQLGLWVTHGVFSGKADELRKYYRHIYTTDSHPGHNRLYCATLIVPTLPYMYQAIEGLT